MLPAMARRGGRGLRSGRGGRIEEAGGGGSASSGSRRHQGKKRGRPGGKGWATGHTNRISQPEVQVLTNDVPDVPRRVGKLPCPKQTPWLVGHDAGCSQVGVGVGRARAVMGTLIHALVEVSVLDMQELVRNLHSIHDHKMVISTSQLLLSPASC